MPEKEQRTISSRCGINWRPRASIYFESTENAFGCWYCPFRTDDPDERHNSAKQKVDEFFAPTDNVSLGREIVDYPVIGPQRRVVSVSS